MLCTSPYLVARLLDNPTELGNSGAAESKFLYRIHPSASCKQLAPRHPEKLRPVNFDRCTSHKEPKQWKDLLEQLQSLFELDILRNRVKAIVPHFRRQEGTTPVANRGGWGGSR